MKKMYKPASIILTGLFALLTSTSVSADWSWNFTGSYTGGGSGMTFSGAGGAPNVTATGWSNANYASSSSSGSYGTGNLVHRNIAQWSGGLGVYSSEDGGSPTHATDNQYRIDSILLVYPAVFNVK